MYLKWNITGAVAFILLGGAIYLWGPGFGSWGRALISCALYAAVFFASFVVVKRR
ncbi:MAG: hypothetical protein J6V32_02600 [Elusimicrobiaceae bacterium]|nr:hypothetical protein [Elusimicrobiaceae bacterium]